MELITLESDAFQKIMTRIYGMEEELKKTLRSSSSPLSERWVDTATVCRLLNCSKRSLLIYRKAFQIPYSVIMKHTYYKATDIDNLLYSNLKAVQVETKKRRVKK